ncbi:MAG TPA: hypothetical protein VEH06_06035 [Candidatus Bathyarchaeia archaeon]|jgi:hypothetical protein|nr:hypothetical protein [Candidatus Bathyarchaeia archaeon]
MLKLKETTLVHSQIFVIIALATMTLLGGMDFSVVQTAYAAAAHGPSDGGSTSPGRAVGGIGKKSDGFLGVWSFML